MHGDLFAIFVVMFAAACGSAATTLFAQSPVPPGDIAQNPGFNTPLGKLTLSGLSLWDIVQIIGYAFAAIKSGGGFKRIFGALVYGDNAPNVVMQNYRTEIGLRQVPVDVQGTQTIVPSPPLTQVGKA